MKLNGYRVTHRNRWLLLQKQILSTQEFLLLEYYLDSMDFDHKHDNYGQFIAYPEVVAEYFKKGIETVNDWRDGLINKSFIEIVDKKREIYRIKSPERYGISFGGKAAQFAKSENLSQTLDNILQNICFYPEKAKIIPKKVTSLALDTPSKALGSSKGELSSFPIGSKKVVLIKQDVRTDSEYQRIYEEGHSEGLIPDDMKWIDENTSEKILIESDEQEKNIVDVFFDGDWDKYQKHLIISSEN